MKRLLLLLLPLYSMAQTFPYDEGFHGIISGTLPAGWQGDMKVQADHGLNDFKGMTADISSVDGSDSAITPWIGPLDNNTEFYFWYRMVDQFIYPSTEKNITGADKFVISYSTDSVNYTPLYSIDTGNHTASLAFKRVIFPITTLNGQTVKFKFWCQFGGGSSYFVDIDSIKIRPNTGIGINDVSADNFMLFPNPVQRGNDVQLLFDKQQEQDLVVYDAMGQVVYSKAPVTHNFSPLTFQLSAPLSPGIYFIRYGTLTRKLVVQ